MNNTDLYATILEQISIRKLVPVVQLEHASNASALAEALYAGGLPVAEITFRTEAAEESIRIIKNKFPEMLVGAGTVTATEQAQRAFDAGASFLVSPGISRPVIEFALDNHLPVFPGACTPSDIMTVMEYSLPVAKFFPAEQYGGLDTIKALAAPFPSVRFMPTGGINASNILKYLACDKIIACGGSWMVKAGLINDGKFDQITRMTAEAVALIAQ